MAIARFECCEISLKTGSLRILPLSDTVIAIEGLSQRNTRRFLLSLTSHSWKLSPDTPAADFHTKLGTEDSALMHLTKALRTAYRVGRIQKISHDFAHAIRDELTPKPLIIRGEEGAPVQRDDEIIKAWVAVDTILQSPRGSKHIERALPNEDGLITHHLLVTYQEQKKSFILELRPFPKPFDSRPAESITLTKETISHFDPDALEPFSSKERAIQVFHDWMKLWSNGSAENFISNPFPSTSRR